MSRNRNRVAAIVGAGVLAAGGAGAGYVARGSGDGGTATVRAAAAASTVRPAAAGKQLSVAAVYKQDRSGVVEVFATQAASNQPFPNGGQGGSQAQGSGFVYDSEGHIVTNEHVVDGATSVSVRFANGKRLTAQVVGKDASTDLAVLKVDALPSGVEPLQLGDSGALQVGDGVIAIGSPFGLQETVTTGIVSALNRQIEAPNNFAIDGAIQTDAAINHGNSGGPLLDLSGNVIGVTSQIQSDSGGNDGVGFAIPSNTVKTIAAQLISNGKVAHAYLGVQIADTANGAKITGVAGGTPAADAGLKAGDVVTSVDGRTIGSATALRSAVDGHKPGEAVELTIRRGVDTKTIKVTLGTRPSA